MKKTHLVLVSALGIMISLIGCSFNSMAVLYPYQIAGPPAQNAIDDYGGGFRFYDFASTTIDGVWGYFWTYTHPAWICTGGNFTYDTWTWPPIPDMPNNASILYVDLIIVFKLPDAGDVAFTLQWTNNLTYEQIWNNDFDGLDWHGPANTTHKTGPITYWSTTAINVTDETVGGPVGGWTPAMLKSNLTWVRFYAYTGGVPVTCKMAIDYIGLRYTWQYEYFGGWHPNLEATYILGITPIAIMGMFGFTGMIAVPVATIWFYRQSEGGSRVYYAIVALCCFLVCFGFFVGSIGGD